jgi:hypothetical protein
MTLEQTALCEAIKRLGYTRNTRVRLYGRIFDLTSDPVCLGQTFVFVDAREASSGQNVRVRIPLTIVRKCARFP